MEALLEETMVLTPAEIEWANTIKQAVADNVRRRGSGSNDDDEDKDSDTEATILRPLSDYEYAHFALVVDRGDNDHGMDEALERIEKLQAFRDEYNINDTVEEGMELLRAFVRQQPWFIVSVDYAAHHGHFIFVYDYAKLWHTAVDDPHDWRIFLGGMYYVLQVCLCNLRACREGLVHIAECEGMERGNFNMDFMQRVFHHLLGWIPRKSKEISWLHTNLEGNLQLAFYKQLFGNEADIIRVGCHFEAYDGRIDEIFKAPSPEIAEARLFAKFLTFLRIRYYHQLVFSLPPPVPAEDDDSSSNND